MQDQEFLRDCLKKATRMHLKAQTVIDLANHYGYRLGIERDALLKFRKGDTRRLGDEAAEALFAFFVATDMGRAIISFDAKTHPYRIIVDAFVRSSLRATPSEIRGTYFGYHRSFRKKGLYSVRALRVDRGPDGLLVYEDYLTDATTLGNEEIFHNKGLVVFIGDKPQFIGVDINTGLNIRLFIAAEVYGNGVVVDLMKGPMTNWTRLGVPANRTQILSRVRDLDYETVKQQTHVDSLEKFAAVHRARLQNLPPEDE